VDLQYNTFTFACQLENNKFATILVHIILCSTWNNQVRLNQMFHVEQKHTDCLTGV